MRCINVIHLIQLKTLTISDGKKSGLLDGILQSDLLAPKGKLFQCVHTSFQLSAYAYSYNFFNVRGGNTRFLHYDLKSPFYV